MNGLSEKNKYHIDKGIIKAMISTDRQTDRQTLYSERGIRIRKKLNKHIKKILVRILKIKFVIDNDISINTESVIMASSHQDNLDFIVSIISSPHYFINLVNAKVKLFFRIAMGLNGSVFVDREKRESRHASKKSLISYLDLGYSVNLYPEGTYNLSPNRLHLPYHIGVIDIAQKTGKPILPIYQEYDYQYNKKGKLYLKQVLVKYGKLLYVNRNDDLRNKLTEFEEIMSTLSWELIERRTRLYKEDGFYLRSEIDYTDYTDYLGMKRRQIEEAGSSLESERQTIFGQADDFYSFFPINSVDLKMPKI